VLLRKYWPKLLNVRTLLIDFSNINVFALIFVVVFTSLVTICNMLILRFFIFMSRFRAALAPRVDHWVQDGIYQLQRRAFEAQGQGCWKNLEQEVPITLDGEKLRELPVESSLALKTIESWRSPRRSRFRKNSTTITEEKLEEGGEQDFGIEKVVRRPTAGTDTMTLVGVDMEKSELKKDEKCEDARW
jgi:hypothetical protein